MATVTIDIPGIGTVEAENAASESTLRELVNLMKKGQGSGGKGSSGGGAGGVAGGDKQSKELKNKTDTLLKTAGVATRAFVNVGEAGAKLVTQFANMGDSLESAAGIFSSIPVVGTMFSAVAGAASKVADSFVAGAASGATFDGTIRSFSESASLAGMTLDKFGGFLAQNGAALVALGGETSSGAKRFSTLSRQLRDSGQDLFALGYSTETLNEGLANYAKQQRILGRSEKMSNTDLVQGSKKYLKEMDLLAKITGETREEKEKEREQLLNDIKFQAFSSQLSKESQEELQLLIQSYPKELQGFVKDAVMSGTLTMEANQAMGHALGGTTNQILGIRQKLLKDERVGDSIIQGALDATKRETQAFVKSNGAAITGNDAYAQAMQPVVGGLKIMPDALEKARKAQEAAAENTDGMNQSVQEARASLAALSNSFLEAIASIGIGNLMAALNLAAGLVRDYVLPAFMFLGENINLVLGAFIAYKGLMLITNGIIATNNFLMRLSGKGLVSLGSSLGSAIGGMIKFTAQLVMSMGRMAVAALTALPGMIAFAAGALAAAAPFLLVAAAVAGVVLIFKAFGGDLEVVKLGFQTWWEGLKMWFNALKLGFYQLLDFIPGLDYSKEIAETKEAIGENAKTMVENVTTIKERMADNREKAKQEKEEKKKQKEQEKKEKEEAKKVAKAETAVKKDEVNSVKNANKELDKERQKNVDYNTTDTVGLLGQELKAQQSSLSGAEAVKAQVISEKTQQQQKEETDAALAKKGDKKEDATTPVASNVADVSSGSSQNSSNELLAALNTKMNTLIRIAGNQLNVQKGMTNDLYNI